MPVRFKTRYLVPFSKEKVVKGGKAKWDFLRDTSDFPMILELDK